MCAPSLDKQLGIEVYGTKSLGIGGVIREEIDDFVVEEVLVDGSKAQIDCSAANRVLGSSMQRQRFLLCVLIKRNWDTFIAVKNVAKQLGIDQACIQIAGIKDAKAVTAQHLTIEGGVIDDVTSFNVKDIQIRPIGYVREALSTYYLLGNSFTIAIKNVQINESHLQARVKQIVDEVLVVGGMPNFFGHQRFGTTRPITHLVGKALIKGEFEEAAMLYLAKPSCYEHPTARQARQELQETRDFKQALEHFPTQLRFERIMLNHLAEEPEDFLGAFLRLPVKLQQLFVQAHQSYLFNRFLSERILHGYALDKAEIGDFVVGVERSGLPLTKLSKIVTEEKQGEINEHIKAGKLRVALPIVGLRHTPPEGETGEIERTVLAQEEITLGDLRVNPLSRVNSRGGLRTIVTPILDFKAKATICNSREKSCRLTLSFMLQRGCYATVLLREIMKPSDPIAAGF